MSTKTCNISETVQDRNKLRYYDGLIGNRIRTFDSYENQFLADRILLHSMIGYWHKPVVRPSVCL